jgi:iron(III) transport system substrate-binding protein
VAWNQLVAAAKQEGALALSAPQGELYRQALTTFSKEYPEINLAYTPTNARDFWPRLRQERDGDQYLWDVRIGGIDLEGYRARDSGVLDPIRPLLLLPEVADDSLWLGGLDNAFADKGKQYVLAFNTSLTGGAFVNRDVIPEAQLPTERELTDARWKGKIVIQDPRGGAGLARLSAYVKTYGEDYVRDLLAKQDVVVSGDKRQMTEWAVRGRYPIAIGLGSDTIVQFQREGLGLNLKHLAGVESPSIDTVQAINRPPHPNAAKLFINWLLTRNTQTVVSTTVQQNSLRADVPTVDQDAVLDLDRMGEYLFTQREEFIPYRERALALASELVK